MISIPRWLAGQSRDLLRMIRLAKQEEIPFLSAAIAYYGFVSVIPGLVMALSIASYLGIEPLLSGFIRATQLHLSQTAQESVMNAVMTGRGRTGATVFGSLFLLWSMLRVFQGLDTAFSRIYGTSDVNSLYNILDAITVVVAVGSGIVIMVAVGAILATADVPFATNIGGFVFLLGGLTLVFLPLYYVFPDQNVTISEVLPGTIFAAVSWVFLQFGFQVYAQTAQQFELYGVLGAALLLVTWFYFAAIAVLFGAIINYARKTHEEVHPNR